MLKRVSIQNFKSLKDVALDLQKVNLLIGPNNSGKSNFLKAINHISDYTQSVFALNRLKEADNRKKLLEEFEYKHEYQVKNYLFNGAIDKIIKISITGTEDLSYDYVWSGDDDELNFIDPSSDSAKEFDQGNYFGKNTSDILSLLNQAIIYRPDPNQFSKPVELESNHYVNETGSNIVSYLFNLSQNRKKDFIELEKNFSYCVGDLVNIGTPSVKTENGNKLKLKFFDKFDNDYWVEEVSEGVLYFLALLCIINQPDPPKLLLLEEPEKGIHPRRIWEVMRFIFQLAEEKDIQIILTTHNEHVVNAFSSTPEAVFVFDKDEEGATHVRNLQRDIIEPSHQKSRERGLDPINFTENLGENWLYGLIGGVPADKQ